MLHSRVGEAKLFKQFGLFSLFSLFIILFGTGLCAESFKDFKQIQQSSIDNLKDKDDREFAKYLKKSFGAYMSSAPKKMYADAKPLYIDKAMATNINAAGPVMKILVDDKRYKTLQKKQKASEKTINKNISFEFFGSKIDIDLPPGIKRAKYYPQNQQGLNNFFSVVASSEYENLLEDILKIKDTMVLNDWGLYLLIDKISKSVFTNDDDSKLLKWFLFVKLGYKAKVGLSYRHIVILYNIKQTLYNAPNYKFGDDTYYTLSNNSQINKRVYSYVKDYPLSKKSFDFSLKKLPLLESDTQEKELKFSHYGREYAIKYRYNKNIINYLSRYPQVECEVFFNAPLQDESFYDIAKGMKKYIDGMQASEAINFVLHFVQKAFVYEVDSKQFGYQKTMFAQETLYFDKSDCEDRAVLFAYLVKKLFNFGIIGVKYKDHISTALYIPIKGDSIKAYSKKYIIADPSYIDANVGVSIPRYKGLKPQKFIKVEI